MNQKNVNPGLYQFAMKKSKNCYYMIYKLSSKSLVKFKASTS